MSRRYGETGWSAPPPRPSPPSFCRPPASVSAGAQSRRHRHRHTARAGDCRQTQPIRRMRQGQSLKKLISHLIFIHSALSGVSLSGGARPSSARVAPVRVPSVDSDEMCHLFGAWQRPLQARGPAWGWE